MNLVKCAAAKVLQACQKLFAKLFFKTKIINDHILSALAPLSFQIFIGSLKSNELTKITYGFCFLTFVAFYDSIHSYSPLLIVSFQFFLN